MNLCVETKVELNATPVLKTEDIWSSSTKKLTLIKKAPWTTTSTLLGVEFIKTMNAKPEITRYIATRMMLVYKLYPCTKDSQCGDMNRFIYGYFGEISVMHAINRTHIGTIYPAKNVNYKPLVDIAVGPYEYSIKTSKSINSDIIIRNYRSNTLTSEGFYFPETFLLLSDVSKKKMYIMFIDNSIVLKTDLKQSDSNLSLSKVAIKRFIATLDRDRLTIIDIPQLTEELGKQPTAIDLIWSHIDKVSFL